MRNRGGGARKSQIKITARFKRNLRSDTTFKEQSEKGETVAHTENEQLPASLLFLPQLNDHRFLRFVDSHLATICPTLRDGN